MIVTLRVNGDRASANDNFRFAENIRRISAMVAEIFFFITKMPFPYTVL